MKIDIKIGETIWKVWIQKIGRKGVAHLVAGKILRSNQVCGSREWIKFIDGKQYYASQEEHKEALWVATYTCWSFCN